MYLDELLRDRSEPFTYLEFGCGNGWLVAHVAKHPLCKRAIGLDVSQVMVAKGKQRFSQQKFPNLCLEQADIMVYPTEPVDIMFSMAALYYIFPMEKFAPRVSELVKFGGTFACGEFVLRIRSSDGMKESTCTAITRLRKDTCEEWG